MAIRELNRPMRSGGPNSVLGPPVHVYRDRANYAGRSSAFVAWNLRGLNFNALLRVEGVAVNLSTPSVPQTRRLEIFERRVAGDSDGWLQQEIYWKAPDLTHLVTLRISIEGIVVPPLAQYSLRMRAQRFNL